MLDFELVFGLSESTDQLQRGRREQAGAVLTGCVRVTAEGSGVLCCGFLHSGWERR